MTDFLGDLRALPGFTLGFFGVQLEGAREVPRKDLVWALMVASEDDEAWVGGGIEFDYEPGGRRLEEAAKGSKALRAVVRALGGSAPLGATRLQASFSFGLDTLTWTTQFQFGSTQEITLAKIVLDLMAFIRNAVAAAQTTDPEFLEVSQVDTKKIADVHGLILTAIIFQSASLIALVLAAYKLPVWFSERLPTIASASAVFASFMQFVGIVTFSSSGLEKAFCDALDPTPDVSKLPCGMGACCAHSARAVNASSCSPPLASFSRPSRSAHRLWLLVRRGCDFLLDAVGHRLLALGALGRRRRGAPRQRQRRRQRQRELRLQDRRRRRGERRHARARGRHDACGRLPVGLGAARRAEAGD